MKKRCLLFLFVLTSFAVTAQNVGIGTSTPNASAQLEITSTNKGVLIPRMSTSQINAIVNPAKGLIDQDYIQITLLDSLIFIILHHDNLQRIRGSGINYQGFEAERV